MDLKEIPVKLSSLVIFRSIAQSEVMTALSDYIRTLGNGNTEDSVKAYSSFIEALYSHGFDLSKYLLNAAVADENQYVLLRSTGTEIPYIVKECVANELDTLSQIAKITPEELIGACKYDGFLPQFYNSDFNFSAEYARRILDVHRNGYGIYAHNVMFNVRDGEIVPVKSADETRIEALFGYENERRQVIDNTRALVEGLPASNILLCGDAGTGKSSTVKAVTNMFAADGVRLIEFRKDQLRDLPAVMEQLRTNPLKFILFIDDLSFNKNDDNFSALKAILEGSASVCASNTVIYATSNRRHLIKETFADRDSDDVHRRDTMQELLSLSDRFGLTILFQTPNKQLYLEIVHNLAKGKKIELDEAELDTRAEAFALKKGSRSARAAEQFTDMLLTEQNLK
ncbi:MAG: ATP-binding protein [Clostridia bacterium]|nr:ATP-binding protein [Clostridia bacterium]